VWVQKQNTEHNWGWHSQVIAACTRLDQGHGTPIWRAAMLTNQYVFHALLPAVEMYGVHWRQSLQAPSRVWAVEATLACYSGTTQDCTGCIHSMQCIPVSKHIHPAAGFVTLPVTTAMPQRFFSTLKRLKTYLRNLRSSMEDEWLRSLAPAPCTCANDANRTCRSRWQVRFTGPHKLNFLR